MWEAIKKFGKDLLDGLLDLLKDFAVWLFEILCDILIYIFESISLPGEFLNYSISTYISADIAFFLSLSGLNQCMVVVGAAILFRIVRRFVTLGIW